MSTSGQHATLGSKRRASVGRALVPVLAVALTVLAGLSTMAEAPDTTVRYLSFAAMLAALFSGVVAIRRGPAGVRAASAVVAVIALMLGSTFFGLTYS